MYTVSATLAHTTAATAASMSRRKEASQRLWVCRRKLRWAAISAYTERGEGVGGEGGREGGREGEHELKVLHVFSINAQKQFSVRTFPDCLCVKVCIHLNSDNILYIQWNLPNVVTLGTIKCGCPRQVAGLLGYLYNAA